MAVIVLHEGHCDPSRRKFLFLPGFKEKSPGITEHAWLDQHDFRQSGRL
jgi:hypothetical protein